MLGTFLVWYLSFRFPFLVADAEIRTSSLIRQGNLATTLHVLALPFWMEMEVRIQVPGRDV